MKAVARNKGPFVNGLFYPLVKDKEYEVVTFSKFVKESSGNYGKWVDYMDDIIPKEPKFYIKIINNGNEEDYWNDYFYSTDELRDKKIEDLLVKSE